MDTLSEEGGLVMRAVPLSPNLVRVLSSVPPDVLAGMFRAGRLLEAEVVTVFRDRAMLSFGKGIRLEVQLEAALQEGQRVRVQVQPREPGGGLVLRLVQQPRPGGPAEAAPQTAPLPGAEPLLVWLPIPLPDGGQAWAQLQIQEEEVRPGGAGPAHQVRLWWETPRLGQVEVALEAAGETIAGRFVAADADACRRLEGALPGLQARLEAAGFARAHLGCRLRLPGESARPARPAEGGSRLDRRL